MKGKILGVLVALCMVCAFVGCADPVSEKPIDEPSINYKDSGFVGTWVTIRTRDTEEGRIVWESKYVLHDDGTGRWSEVVKEKPLDVIPGAAGARAIVWLPRSDGKVELTETLIENPDRVDDYQGSLSDNNTKLTVNGTIYTKQP